jgi:hypothetical protein
VGIAVFRFWVRTWLWLVVTKVSIQPTDSMMPQFPQISHSLQPAKDLFHYLALLLADSTTTVPRRGPIDGSLALFVVLRHRRRRLHLRKRQKEHALKVMLKGASGGALEGNL